jgi:regulator of protease activity HflC (stomatin/prohibitin superfamily)
MYLTLFIGGLVLLILTGLVISTFAVVDQGKVAVVTSFGKYRRILRPGLNFLIPILENIYARISIQNRSIELSFQAITSDQANVNFKTMLVFAVFNQDEETIKNVAFKFVDDSNLMQALTRTVEGSIRAYVATQRQAAVLSLRSEIVLHVKDQLDETLKNWGYQLIDLQLNDIAFDQAIMQSMAKVVASNNLKAAAENEGQALLITKTKSAEAEGNAIKISAEAEKIAAQLRGQGVALFREEVSKGLAHAVQELQDSNIDPSLVFFSMWTEAIKHFADHGQGNVIFLDGSNEGLQKNMQQMMAMQHLQQNIPQKPQEGAQQLGPLLPPNPA